jgi:CPA2 family monovalent cation:H+ antiporter-2
VLFFVAVGMLFDPRIVVRHPAQVATVIAIVIVGKSIVATAIARAFRYPRHTALTLSASLAQIGEFSFVLSGLAASLGIFPADAPSYIIAGAIFTIGLNPIVFRIADRAARAR